MLTHSKRLYFQYRQVGSCIQKVIQPICKKQGLFHADLFLNWASIVGTEFAKSHPVKITKCRNETNPSEYPKGVFVLWLKAPPSMTAQLTYCQDLLKERIHTYFGYKFLHEIRFQFGKEIFLKPQIQENFSQQSDDSVEEALKSFLMAAQKS